MTGRARPPRARESAFMRRALALARLGWGQTAPNPMVGAVVVRDGMVVGEGHHAAFGEPHAETAALAKAGERARGATLYVTLEPCNHHGKTPPCVDAIIAAGITKVVAAVRDPTSVAGGGAERLRAAGIDVAFGDGAEEATELNAAFLRTDQRRPWVMLKLATSIDGAIADAEGGSKWITGERARREAHRMRANSDAIMIGVTTAVADDPELTVRMAPRRQAGPARVVVDPSARLPLASKLVRTARQVPTLVLVTPAAPRDRVAALEAAGVQVIAANGLEEWLQLLRAKGYRSLLVEGGAHLAGALLSAQLVDRLAIFQAPLVLGPGALNAFGFAPAQTLQAARRWRPIERKSLGEDALTVFAPEETR